MSDKRNTFWMVWRQGSGSTRFQHWTKEEAVTEAERLARTAPGETFYVLKATAAVVSELPPVKHMKMVPNTDAEIPW